jgi:O-antigen ligase
VTFQSAASAKRPLAGGLGIVVLGALIGLVAVVAVAALKPVFLIFAFGGLVLLLPALVMRDPRAYGLLLLVLSFPFDIAKRTTSWIADPTALLGDYGLPARGTLSIDLYLTDVVLIVMLVPWFLRLVLRRDHFYFPKFAYLFVLYLAWTLITSLLQATSFTMSIFEWCRELLYFIFFLYFINNIVTRTQLRAIVLALLIGLTVEAGTVITLFHFNVGTETFVLSSLYTERSQLTAADTLPVGTSDEGKDIKRSAGTFEHPLLAAYYFEFGLAIALVYLLMAPRIRDRILFGAVFAAGTISLYLTFSRSGLVGFLVGSTVIFPVARWSRLISRRVFAWYVCAFAAALLLSAPLVIRYIETRPTATTARWELLDAGINAFLQRPLFGAGLNNSSIVLEGVYMPGVGGTAGKISLHNHYLVVLTETGLVGFLLFFGFFWQIIQTAFRSMRAAETEMKLLLVGIVGALASVATHNFGDAFWGNVTNGTLWLYAGVIIAISRQVQLERAVPSSPTTAAGHSSRSPLPGTRPAPFTR